MTVRVASVLFLPLIVLIAGCDRLIREQDTKVASLNTIVTANVSYKSTYGTFAPNLQNLGGALPCTSSAETSCLIDPVLSSGHKSGFNFYYVPGERDGKGKINSYSVVAEPDDHKNQDYWYYIDQTGVTRYEVGKRPTASSPEFH